MDIEKVDLSNGNFTYSSYVKAGDFIFTSIASGTGATTTEAAENAVKDLERYLTHAGSRLEDLVKITVTLRDDQNFDELKPVFKKHFPNGYPARNTILVHRFLDKSIKMQIEGIAYRPQELIHK